MKNKILKILKKFNIKPYRTSNEEKLDQIEYPISKDMLAELIAEGLKD